MDSIYYSQNKYVPLQPKKKIAMAINYGMHRLAGSIGNETHYIDPRTGKEVVRRKKPTKVRNPRSDKQREHRNHFLDIVHRLDE